MESSSMTRPKKRLKFPFFNCFKSQHDALLPRRKKKTADPLLTYIAVAEKQGMVLPTILSSALTAAKVADVDGRTNRRKKSENDNSLRQALVEAFNHSSLAKKIFYRRKKDKDKLEGGDKISKKEREITRGTNSNTCSSSRFSPAFTPSSLSSISTSSSSTSTSTLASGSSPEPYPPKSLPINGEREMKQKQCTYFGPNMGLCLLFIISLLVLILWGKACAIVCTSLAFFVPPTRRRRPYKEGSICEENEFNSSVQHKK
ncbi:hypothetical protein RJT34_30288 [Clitoria ternatea]|uniref:Uncharacterized protein n=1 Tax=Clitoria ternatea TaxID=43366 RepID=A0AAN9EUA7_CLITE